MKFSALIPFVLGAALHVAAQVADPQKAAELLVDLKNAPTQVARLNILKNNEDVSTSVLWLMNAADGLIDRLVVV